VINMKLLFEFLPIITIIVNLFQTFNFVCVKFCAGIDSCNVPSVTSMHNAKQKFFFFKRIRKLTSSHKS
jgi:hypothetical protein